MSACQEYFEPSHQLVRDSVRRFVEREILPQVDVWEEQGSFPLALYRQAGAAGILGIGYPEAFGGSHEGDLFAKVAASEELMRCGSGGLVAGLGSLDIGLPPVLRWALPALRERVVPAVLAGEKVIALSVTEPYWRLRRGQSEDPRGARGGFLSGQRQQDFHHQWRARGLLHRGGAHR